ncbi:hypothetical protein AMECASPLE_028647 [Ameca splendens]|uniref:Uncharacterized protein n=1 Tax=Ameca splendens TaxID=208324 RepID=A0ABV0YSK9_9TELE
MAAGAHGDRGSSAPGHVEVGWSFPTGSALTLCLRMEGSTVRDRGFGTSPATQSRVTPVKVNINLTLKDTKRSKELIAPLDIDQKKAVSTCLGQFQFTLGSCFK